MKLRFTLLLLILTFLAKAQGSFTISGYVSDSASGEMLIGASVYVEGTTKGTAANVYGFYSLTLAAGDYTIICNYIGYHAQKISVSLNADQKTDFKLSNSTASVRKEVVVTADRNRDEVRSTQTSMITIPVDKVRTIPTIGGETDIIKVVQLMPGVKRGGEGQNTMFVRGGSGDDNLILLDEATVYNVSHLFGFFSVFNNDALKDVTLIKGGFPAQYGGRLSSVMDVRMKDGDMEKFHAAGGIGLLSSHLTIEGPLKKDTSSFLISARRSYIDKVFKLAYHGQNVLPYFFYDANVKWNYILSSRDRIFVSGYFGDDVLSAKEENDSSFFDGGFKLGNFTTTARWNHTYNSKLFSNISFIHTRFRYDVEASIPGNSFLTRSRIQDFEGVADYSYFRKPGNTVRFGMAYTTHVFRPNVVSTSGEISDYLRSREGTRIFTNEIAFYGNYECDLDSNFRVSGGLRLATLVSPGKTYFSPEPRLSGTYILSDNQSFKLSYSRMTQFLHLVSSSSIALPTDLWYPVTKNVKPIYADQIAAGYDLNVPKIKTLFTFEAYYKWMQNLIEYREGAVLILNDNYEQELVSGNGHAYGFEFFAQKQEGKFTGWVGYTISWSIRQFDELNHGNPYFAKYDRRHDISVVMMYEFTKRFSVSAVWVFSTGQRFTPETGNFLMPDATLTSVNVLPIYTDKNAIVLPPAHRLDINFVLKSRLNRKWMKWTGEWQFGAYNVYNRAQPYKIKIVPTDNGTYKYEAVGLFGFIPSIAYNFRF
ncbi:MAG TPA: carboxypeptidase-like regulatory domain-containing protein [Bacteroidia bacterium]|nr:carboxypeptidase-like regulatory domain-containing protein [Bacteroidia bacterium]